MADIIKISTGEPLEARFGIVSDGRNQHSYNFELALNVGSGNPRVNNDVTSSGITGNFITLTGTAVSGQFIKTNGTSFFTAIPTNGYWFNVKDYGAVGDGVTDDSVAFKRVMTDLWSRVSPVANSGVGTGYRGITGSVYLPYGKYRVNQSGVLTPPVTGSNSLIGLRIIGDGFYNSQILYTHTSGYLLDGTANIGATTIENVGFVGLTGREKGILLKDTGQGRSYEITFLRSLFDNFGIAVECSGTTNCSEMTYYSCLFRVPSGGTGVRINNPQAVTHEFHNTGFSMNYGGISLDLLSGGAINFYGGSMGGYGSGYVLRVQGDFGSNGPGNDVVSYYGTRFEVYDDMKLCFINNITKQVSYNTTSIAAVGNSGTYHVEILEQGKVNFHQTIIPDNFRARIGTNYSAGYTMSMMPTLRFANCILSKQLNDFVTINSSTGSETPAVGSRGRAFAEDCTGYSISYPQNKDPIDTSLNDHQGNDMQTTKMKCYTWLYSSDPDGGLPVSVTSAVTSIGSGIFKLPVGATIRKVGIERTNAQQGFYGAGRPFNHQVTNYDRSIIFCHASGVLASTNATFWSSDLYYRIDSEAQRTIQVLGSGGSGLASVTSGRVFIEYY